MCTFSLPKWRGRRTASEGMKAREKERECYKRLSPRKHGVSLSSHMWNRHSGQSDALMEINQSDTTSTFETFQQSPPTLLSSCLCLSLSFLSPSSQGHLATVNRHITIVLSTPASFTPYLVVSPLIINATHLIRSISPPLSRPLTPTSCTQGVRIKDGQ